MSRVIAIRQGRPRAVVMAGLRGKAGEQGEQGTPFQVDATGLLANRGAFDAEPEGFAYLATDTGDLYFRQGAAGNWSDPVPFQGPAGDSAYQVAVASGFVGTEAEWLESLAGADGVDGLSITGAAIDGNGHLLLNLSNSTVLDAGYVVGPAGENGTNGADGRGIASMAIDGSNHLIITYTDTTTEDAGLIPGAGGSAVWGGIGGTLSDQTDLQSALDDKAQVGSSDPQPLGAAAPGVSTSASRQDHVHAMPSAADVGAIPVAEKGVADGVAPLDSSGKVAAAYLPSFVDDVLEFANLAAFPATGESGKIYVALDSNKAYRWAGSSYIEISPSPGSTDAVAEGATNLYHTAARVLATVLSGLSLAVGGAITSADTVLVAFGKLQRQINDLATAISGKQDTLVSATNIKTINGNSLLGAGDLSIAGDGAVSSVNGKTGAVQVLVPIIVACSDESTALTAGSAKVTFRMPYAFSVTGVLASLTTAQASGSILTIDINEGGASILSTKLTIDNTEKTSATAATAPVISDSAIAADAEITIDIDQIGDGTAKGLKVTLVGYQP
ncbi:hypothetical protein [Ectopseudomonas khazarica]|uniref:hypothetical protein n=1 Tax=Ectopseudomonas khazarica TaxID=2502979 RepID=UPI003B956E6D